MAGGAGSLAERLRWARERAFVGRTAELAEFRAALAGAPGSYAVLYVHGPGGVGKSTLLRRFADLGHDAGRTVVEIDGRAIDPSPAGFAAEAARATTDERAVLLVDSFERCQGLEGWLRDRFLPELPAGALVVLAGREPPSPAWTSDLAWSDALRVVALGDLAPDEAEALLAARRVAPEAREAVLAFAGGHPLALSLAAAVAAENGAATWTPTPDVLAALLARLVGETPSPRHRLALEVAAHAMTTTEGLLRAVVGPQEAEELFTWLRRLPFADWGRHGLFLHDLVRDAIDADLRWRDPQGYEEMHRRVVRHLRERARTVPEADAVLALRELTYLKRYGVLRPYYETLQQEGDAYEDTLRPGDRAALRRMALQTEGEESAALVDFWLERQPAAFWVYRDSRTNAPVAFLTWLRLTAGDAEAAAADPVTAAAWEHAHRTSPLRPGEHLAMARFMIYPAAYQEISPVGHLMQLRIGTHWIRAPGLAWSFLVTVYADLWRPLLEHLGHRAVATVPWPTGRTCTLFACDMREMPLEVWHDRILLGSISGPPAAAEPAQAPAALSRAEFTAAVREALREWHRPDRLAASPLLRSRLVAGRTGGEAVAALREVIAAAVEELQADPRAVKLHRVVATTYLRRVPSQAAAAERLGLPFSTYRRHLRQGVDRVCELLWHRESGVGQAPPAVRAG